MSARQTQNKSYWLVFASLYLASNGNTPPPSQSKEAQPITFEGERLIVDSEKDTYTLEKGKLNHADYTLEGQSITKAGDKLSATTAVFYDKKNKTTCAAQQLHQNKATQDISAQNAFIHKSQEEWLLHSDHLHSLDDGQLYHLGQSQYTTCTNRYNPCFFLQADQSQYRDKEELLTSAWTVWFNTPFGHLPAFWFPFGMANTSSQPQSGWLLPSFSLGGIRKYWDDKERTTTLTLPGYYWRINTHQDLKWIPTYKFAYPGKGKQGKGNLKFDLHHRYQQRYQGESDFNFKTILASSEKGGLRLDGGRIIWQGETRWGTHQHGQAHIDMAWGLFEQSEEGQERAKKRRLASLFAAKKSTSTLSYTTDFYGWPSPWHKASLAINNKYTQKLVTPKKEDKEDIPVYALDLLHTTLQYKLFKHPFTDHLQFNIIPTLSGCPLHYPSFTEWEKARSQPIRAGAFTLPARFQYHTSSHAFDLYGSVKPISYHLCHNATTPDIGGDKLITLRGTSFGTTLCSSGASYQYTQQGTIDALATSWKLSPQGELAYKYSHKFGNHPKDSDAFALLFGLPQYDTSLPLDLGLAFQLSSSSNPQHPWLTMELNTTNDYVLNPNGWSKLNLFSHLNDNPQPRQEIGAQHELARGTNFNVPPQKGNVKIVFQPLSYLSCTYKNACKIKDENKKWTRELAFTFNPHDNFTFEYENGCTFFDTLEKQHKKSWKLPSSHRVKCNFNYAFPNQRTQLDVSTVWLPHDGSKILNFTLTHRFHCWNLKLSGDWFEGNFAVTLAPNATSLENLTLTF